MPQIKRRRVLAAKIETTVGTAESLTASDAAFNVYNPMIQANIAMEEREGQGGFGYLAAMPGARGGTVTFRTMLEWDGTSTEPAWADTFFPACGWVKSTTTYNPTSEVPGTNVKTLTIALYEDDGAGSGVIKTLTGCMGTFVVTLPTGRQGFIDWTFTGVWQAPTTGSILNPTYPTATPLRYAGGLAEWNDVNLCVEQAVIDAGNEVILRECPTTASGYISALVTNRRPKITVNPEAVALATQNRWSAWLASSEFTLELDVDGPSTSVLSFDAPKAQILNLQEGDRNMMVTDEIEFGCNKNGATHDQELQIVFTPS